MTGKQGQAPAFSTESCPACLPILIPLHRHLASGSHSYKAPPQDLCSACAHCLLSCAQSLSEFPGLTGLLSSYFSVHMFPPQQSVT